MFVIGLSDLCLLEMKYRISWRRGQTPALMLLVFPNVRQRPAPTFLEIRTRIAGQKWKRWLSLLATFLKMTLYHLLLRKFLVSI